MPEVIAMGGLELRFLQSKEDTGGSLDLFEMTVQPNARMPVPHYHESWDETVYGLAGATTWHVDGQDVTVKPGQSVFIRRGIVHGFRNDTQAPATCLCVLSPGVLGPAYFREVAALLAQGAPDLAKSGKRCCATGWCRFRWPERATPHSGFHPQAGFLGRAGCSMTAARYGDRPRGTLVNQPLPNSFRQGPDSRGRFGQFGGRFVAETLMPLILEVEQAYEAAKRDPAFDAELAGLLTHYVGRPSPLWFADDEHCAPGSRPAGAQVYFKRDELNHTGSAQDQHCLGRSC